MSVAQCEAARSNQSLSLLHAGECCPSDAAGEGCPEPGPVCASDGRTHDSVCAFNASTCLQQRRTGHSPHLLHKGPHLLLSS